MKINKIKDQKNLAAVLLIIGLLVIILSLIIPAVASQEVTVCCEKTTYGAYCQNEPAEKCDTKYRQTPTSCEATSFCKKGCCYDSDEGICMENTPQKVCEDNNGVWDPDPQCSIPQCNLGCCILGDQAAFVSLVRCKKLSGFYGLTTDFRTNIGSEIECIAIAQAQDKGACVFESDFQKTCKFTTRAECDSKKISGEINGTVTGTEVSFYKDYLCSAPELGTNCGMTTKTMCVEGKDEVYFQDSCGNPANIYDASKIKDQNYWTKIVAKEDSCGFGKDNAGSTSCGNCDYFLGSMCKQDGSRNYCADLDCKGHKHGESWCSYDGEGELIDAVGSRHFRHVCYMGEETIEPCDDFRNEQCIESSIETEEGEFSQAACRVNRWQDCVGQDNKEDCENIDKGDCVWIEKTKLNPGRCVPKIAPGLKFWEDSATDVCVAGNTICVVKFEKKIIGGKKCVRNCHCLEPQWEEKQNKICTSLGDCGAKINYINVYTDKGYEKTVKRGRTGSVIQGMFINLYNKITRGTEQEISNKPI